MSESGLLLAGHVLTADTYAGQPEADIEDIIGSDTYLALVNSTYGLTGSSSLSGPTPAATTPQRIVTYVEETFRRMPPETPEFDHYAPAEHLITRPASPELPGLAAALDRFERLFTALNQLLQELPAPRSVLPVVVRPVTTPTRKA